MLTWAERTNAVLERSRREYETEQAEKQTNKAEKFQRRHVPMKDRVAAVIKAMPDSEKSKPRSLSFFQAALRPKFYGTGSHAGETGQALRALHWSPRRVDTNQGRCMFWFPPANGGE